MPAFQTRKTEFNFELPQLRGMNVVSIFLLLVSYQAITFTVFAWALRRLDDHFGRGVTFLAPVVYVACDRAGL